MSFELLLVLKTTLVLVAAALLSLFMRRTSANARHALWFATLFVVLLFPLAGILLPSVDLPILSERPVPAAELGVSTPVVVEPTPPLYVPIRRSVVSPVVETPSTSHWSARQWLLLVWLSGGVVVFSGWLYAVWELWRLKRASSLLTDDSWRSLLAGVRRELGVTSRIELRMASGVVAPMTWGVFRNLILLPCSAVEWRPERRRLVLEHEMAHVMRHDGLSQVLAQTVCSLHWFNPLAWYAASRLRIECEHVCDDVVLSLGAPAADYADHLVDIARDLNSRLARTAIAMAHPSQLKSRVLAILDGRRRSRPSWITACVISGVIGFMTAPAATVRLTAVTGLVMPAAAVPGAVLPQPQALTPTPLVGPTGTGDASIEGRVLILDRNEPVRGARVILNTEPISETPLVAVADENGRFEFRKVASGKYQLLATHEGYVRGVYGQRSLNSPGTSMEIAAGQNLKSLVVTLTPTGSISGRIRDRFGDAAANVAVRALKVSYVEGRRRLIAIQTARTNDLGDYRLYYLEPGQYVVSALPPEGPVPVAGNSGGIGRLTVLPGSAFTGATPTSVITAMAAYTSQGIVSSSDTGETYVPLYFPGVADLSAATQLDLQPGGTVKSADFIVSEVRAARIRGQVRDTAGQPVKGVALALVPQGDVPAAFDRYGGAKDDGSFEMRGIPPGAYDLVASAGDLPRGTPGTSPAGAGGALIDRADASAAAAAADSRVLGRASLRVASADLDNVALTLKPGFRINGKIAFEGISPAETPSQMAGLTVQLIPASVLQQENDSSAMGLRRSRSFSMPGAVSSEGAFSIPGVFPGMYRIAIRGASKFPAGAYVKSARIDGADVLSPRFVLDSEPRGELEIVISTASGTLRASVVDEKQAPAHSVKVVLVPDAASRQRYELYFKALTDSAGKAQLENIPPGDYQVYAWEVADDGAWWDPEFLRKYEGQGKPVRVDAGGVRETSLKSIR